MTIPPFRVSHSKLTLASCALALRNSINKVPHDTPPYENQQAGTDVHAIYNAVNNYEGVIDDEVLDQLLSENVVQHFADSRVYAQRYMRQFSNKPTLSEFKIGLDMDLYPCDFDAPEAAFVSVLDRVDIKDKWARILDHKLTWQIGKPLTSQTSFYGWIFNKTFPNIDDIEVGINYIRYSKFQTAELYHDDLVKIERGILAHARRAWAVTGNKPTPGEACKYCPWAMGCPASKSDVMVIKRKEDAEAMAANVHVLKKQLAEKQKLLKVWVNDNGPIRVTDKLYYGFKVTSSVKPNTDSLSDAIEENPEVLEKISLSKGNCLKFNVETTLKYGTKWSDMEVEEDD